MKPKFFIASVEKFFGKKEYINVNIEECFFLKLEELIDKYEIDMSYFDEHNMFEYLYSSCSTKANQEWSIRFALIKANDSKEASTIFASIV